MKVTNAWEVLRPRLTSPKGLVLPLKAKPKEVHLQRSLAFGLFSSCSLIRLIKQRRVQLLGTSQLWEELLPSDAGPLEVTPELLKAAWDSSGFRDPNARPPLHCLAQVAFPHLFPTPSSAKKALRRGYVLVDGETMSSSSLSPAAGSILTAFVDRNLVQSGRAVTIDQRLQKWNAGKPESAQIRVLHHDREAAWAVVNKPPGLHTSPVGIDAWQNLTLQSYLPAILEPPVVGTACRTGPRPCHRLDMLVAGPVAVATSEEAMRSLNHSFRTRQVHKEYRAILCGFAGHAGDVFSIEMPVDDKPSHTDVEILRVVPDDHYGSLTEVVLKPLEGRRHQLRIHCAASGIPIVNDVASIYALADQRWLKRHGTELPQQKKRGQGLFLQAVKLAVPHPIHASLVKVEVDVARKFQKLLDQSYQRAMKMLRCFFFVCQFQEVLQPQILREMLAGMTRPRGTAPCR